MSKARDQVAKEHRICRLLRGGASVERVASMFDLTPTRIRQIRATWKDVGSLPPNGIPVDGAAEARRMVDRLEMIGEDLLVLAEQTEHDGVRLGALRDRRENLVTLMQLKAEAGLIPRHLASANLQQEFVLMVRELVDALRRRNVDEDTIREVLEVAERAPAAELEAVAA